MSRDSGESGLIVGAGLAGCMVGVLLAKKGVRVTVLEGREDWRKGSRAAAVSDLSLVLSSED